MLELAQQKLSCLLLIVKVLAQKHICRPVVGEKLII